MRRIGDDSRRAAAGTEAPRAAPMRVLIADDDESHRKLLSTALATEGHETVEAVDGVDALEKLGSGGFDAVISDVLMPRMDGYRLSNEVRRNRDLRNTRIIVFSRTHASMADARMALKAGADRFIRNPLGTKTILRALRDATRARRQRKATIPPATKLAPVSEYSEVLVRRLESANLKIEASRKRLARANEEIRESEERVRLLLDSTAEGIYGLDLEGNFTFCNAAGLAMLGYNDAAELLGRNALTLIRHTRADGGSYPMGESGALRAMRENRGSHAEDEILWRADGTSFPAESWSHPVRKGGKLIGAVVTFLDITDRKRVQEALKTSEKRFRSLIENSPDIVAILKPDGRIRYVSPSIEGALGHRPGVFVGKNAFHLVAPEDAPRLKARMGETPTSGAPAAPILFRFRHRDGSWRAFEAAGHRLAADLQSEGVVLTFRDVTNRLKREAALRESEERFRTLFESNTIGIAISDLSGNTLEANESYLNMLGFTREELLAGKVRWRDLTPEEHRGRDQTAIELLQAMGKASPWEKELFRKDGERVPILIGVAMLKASPGGNFISYIVDLTERRRLERQFLQAQKMEAVGKLAGGVAHDFNNLLTVILGYSALLAAKLESGSLEFEELEEIRAAGERAASLTRQLLAFSRLQVLERKVLDVNDLVARIEKMLRRLIGEDVELVTVLSPALPRVFADAGQLEQVIMNLAVNARDAITRGGTLTIETANVELDEAYARQHATVRPGRYVMIAVSDTGAGMNAETLAHMFEPFFTTKETGKGTGLGLAMVYGIVNQSGGHVWVYSEVEQGTTVKIYLPRVEAGGEAAPFPEAMRGSLVGTETVLLVEDEASVRALSCSILKTYGYTVLEAASGRDGLDIARDYPLPIHLLLTDVVMPEMGGSDLASRLEAVRPGVRVLYMSGYTDDAIFRHRLLEKGLVFLQKPFTPEALARKMREALGG